MPLIAREVTTAGWACTVLPLTTLPRTGSAGPAAFDAVILSGTDLPAWAPVYHDELDLIRSGRVPLLGICGGLQLIGRAFGADLEEGAPVIGRTRVDLAAGIPLFAGMPGQVELFQRHIYRLASLPPGWEAIATSANCKLEGIWNRSSGSYGMQAHLEFRAEGRAMLRRFLALAEHRPPAEPGTRSPALAVIMPAVVVVPVVVRVRMIIGGGSALTGRIGRHSTAGLAVVAAACLAAAQLEEGVGRSHPHLGSEGRVVGDPVGKQGPRAWSRPGFRTGLWHNPDNTANAVTAPVTPCDHLAGQAEASHTVFCGAPPVIS